MSISRRCLLISTLALTGLLPVTASAQTREDATVNAASATLNEIMSIPANAIPGSLLSKAQGIAIVPGVVKGGLIVGIRHGRGVLMTRNENGSWKGPAFVSLTGGSVGWQVGVQSTDVVLVFRTRKSIDGLLRGKFTIGADAAVAAGPVGRKAAAATDASLRAEILSYSKSRGLFVGVSLDGSVLEVDPTANAAYYRTTVGANGQPTQTIPQSAYRLVNTLAAYTAPPQAAGTAAVATAPPIPVTSAPAAAPPNPLQTQLAEASTALQALVDDNWRRYLALPEEIYAGRPVAADSLQVTLGRFDSLLKDGRYAALTSRAEFTQTHQLLRQYLAAVKRDAQIRLPPPPSAGASLFYQRLPF